MSSSYNLVTAPWIECVDTQGNSRVVGLAELVSAADELALAELKPLVRSAVWRLLAAVCYAAGAYPHDQDGYLEQIQSGIDLPAVGRYLDEHAQQFELFDPERPFMQDPTLACAIGTDSERPALYLDVTAAIDRPLHFDDRHLVSAQPLTYRQATHALLVQHTWGFGGRTQGVVKDLGPGSSNYGIPSPAVGRVVLCPEPATVAEALAWRVTPTVDAGQPWWTWPASPPGSAVAVGGEASGLTWPSRRVLLVPGDDGLVRGMITSRGLAYKHPGVDDPVTGWADILTNAKGFVLGNTIVHPEDPLPLIAQFSHARPDSLLRHVMDAATQLGHGVNLVAYSLVAESRLQRKALVAYQVAIPAQALHVPHAAEVASVFLSGRDAVSQQHIASDIELYLQWLSEKPDRVDGVLSAIEQHLLRQIAMQDVPYSADAVHRANSVHLVVKKATANLVTSHEDKEASMPDTPSDIDLASLFEDDLFGSTGSSPSRQRDTRKTDPSAVLMSRLTGYVTRVEHRGTLNRLADYARRPTVACEQMEMVIRGLPAEHTVAATAVAALFAHAHQSVRRPLTGKIPLSRVARSFGGTKRGPANTDVRLVIDRATHTPAHRLLPVLLPLTRHIAQAGNSRVDWADLYDTLVAWDDRDCRARTRWSWLFYKPLRVNEIDDLLMKGMSAR